MEDDEKHRVELGARFKEARALLALSKSQAARESGLYQRDISQIEDGVKRFIPTRYLQYLCMRIDLNSLFDERMEVAMRELPGEVEMERSPVIEKLTGSAKRLQAIAGPPQWMKEMELMKAELKKELKEELRAELKKPKGKG